MNFFSPPSSNKKKSKKKSNKIIDRVVLPLIKQKFQKIKERFNGRVEREGAVIWYRDGILHNNDEAAIVWEDGSYQWYYNGLIHRIGGPAAESNGNKYWYFQGKRHRLDGAAVEFENGMKEWWIEGNQISEEEFKEQIQKINNRV